MWTGMGKCECVYGRQPGWRGGVGSWFFVDEKRNWILLPPPLMPGTLWGIRHTVIILNEGLNYSSLSN